MAIFFANILFVSSSDYKLIIDRIMTDGNLSRQPEIHIQVSVPNEFTPMAKYNIGVTAGIETTSPKPEWIEGVIRMDMNIVPSVFSKEVLWTHVLHETRTLSLSQLFTRSLKRMYLKDLDILMNQYAFVNISRIRLKDI